MQQNQLSWANLIYSILKLDNLLYLKLILGCDTVRSGPGFRGGEPGPAGPGLKNIGTGPDWKSGWSSPDTRRAAKLIKKTSY
jgi:hypothetical protein